MGLFAEINAEISREVIRTIYMCAVAGSSEVKGRPYVLDSKPFQKNGHELSYRIFRPFTKKDLRRKIQYSFHEVKQETLRSLKEDLKGIKNVVWGYEQSKKKGCYFKGGKKVYEFWKSAQEFWQEQITHVKNIKRI